MKFRHHLSILFCIMFLASCEPPKTKSTLDRIYELDPKGKIYISSKLKETPPKTVAILPFNSLIGEGRIEGSRSLFNTMTGRSEDHPELLAARMRRSFFGQFSQLEFDHVKLSRIDRMLQKEGLDSWEKLRSASPQHLGELLKADALVFGEVTHFDYYYALLYTQLAVGLSMEMVETKTGEILWRVEDSRRDHTVRVVYDPFALAVGLFQAGFSLRPINMMRAMDEICRELVGTIPPPIDPD
jgi:PBP1b-binding outer membrane lipoprotein LpoB